MIGGAGRYRDDIVGSTENVNFKPPMIEWTVRGNTGSGMVSFRRSLLPTAPSFVKACFPTVIACMLEKVDDSLRIVKYCLRV